MPELLLRGTSIGTIQGVLFDKDGTLSNSESHLLRVAKERINQAAQIVQSHCINPKNISKLKVLLSLAYGLTSEGLKADGTIAVASRDQNLITTASVFCLIGESWPNAVELAQQTFERVDFLEKERGSNSEERTLLPGALNLLKKLQEAGLACALISNDTASGIKFFVSKNNLQGIITDFWSAENKPSKPDPGAVKGLCKILRLNPDQCVLIGDADSDLRMSRQAGVKSTLGYVSGWSIPPKLTEYNYLIHHWDELTVQMNPN